MSGEINYKTKYQELKSKFMQSVDMAFRLGFEEGSKQSEMNQMQQAQQQQAQLDQAQANGMGQEDQGQIDDGQDGATQPAGPGQGIQQADSQNPAGSELDQHIQKLESMLGKSELSSEDLKKTLNDIKTVQANIKFQSEMKKSAQAIPAIAKALHKPTFKLSKQASHNMDSNAKTAVTLQHKIVDDIMKSWNNEAQKASNDIKQILNIEGLAKKE